MWNTFVIMTFPNFRNVPHLDEFDSFSDPYVKCYFLSDGEEGKGVKFYETPPLQNVEHGGWEIPIRFDNYMKGTRQVRIFASFPLISYRHT